VPQVGVELGGLLGAWDDAHNMAVAAPVQMPQGHVSTPAGQQEMGAQELSSHGAVPRACLLCRTSFAAVDPVSRDITNMQQHIHITRWTKARQNIELLTG
jgi:hypothetical protein